MSEPFRVHGPGGPSELPGAKKDKTIGPNDFKKYMVEEVKEIDPHQKRNRRRRQEEEEDVEEAKKAISAPNPSQPTPMGQVSAPAGKQPSTTQYIPSVSSAAPPSTSTPMADFSAESIEEFAWEEDTSPSLSSQTPPQQTAQSPTTTPSPAAPSTSSAPPPSSQAGYVEEPTYAQTEQVEEAPSQPPVRYGSETYATQSPSEWEGYATTPSRTEAGAPKESDQSKADSQSKYREDQTVASSKKKSKKAKVTEQQLREVTTLPKKMIEKPATSEDVTTLEKAVKAVRKKGKAPPMLGVEEKPIKQTSADFKKLMQETPPTPSAEDEQVTEEVTQPTPSAAKKRGKKASLAAKSTPKIPLPIIEKLDVGALAPATPGTLPADLSSTKKAPTDKLLTKKASEREELADVEEEGLAIPPLTQAPSSAQGEAGGEKRRRSPGELIAESVAAPPPAGSLTPSTTLPTTPVGVSSTSPYAEIHPEILDFFERLVGVMTVMQTAGITETTMTLNEKTFANSPLLGASITIRTYDIAPKEMNVEFSGSPQALAQMQQNLPSLLAAFQAGNYNFVVKRFDFKVRAAERPIFKRKEELRERSGNLNDEERE